MAAKEIVVAGEMGCRAQRHVVVGVYFAITE
jgi:hypothetical protein